MDKCISCANEISKKKLYYCKPDKQDKAKENFAIWQETAKKEDVDHYYQDPAFGAVYVERLYSSRARSFYEVLGRVGIDDQIKTIMKSNMKVVSIGCGPGPEIAAYVEYMRRHFSYKLKLNILALDAVNHWKDFVMAMGGCDNNITITFQNVKVDCDFIAKSALSGVCLISYPEAVNFVKRFWDIVKSKFDLVVVLDQSKAALHKKLKDCGYLIDSMEYNGLKNYAIFFKKPIVSTPTPRQLQPIINKAWDKKLKFHPVAYDGSRPTIADDTSSRKRVVLIENDDCVEDSVVADERLNSEITKNEGIFTKFKKMIAGIMEYVLGQLRRFRLRWY